ncbi:hypothetical protein QQX98_009205 [Neonectria punicea]|uniref:Gylcosyl hydrolase 115 C-terminal domain-containing protein n=1 Tax=Neonectria punicea TaxID=979145 RepID=A0ABR1GTF6_9HYPO
MFEDKFVQFSASTGSIDLVDACIVVDVQDWPGVRLAAESLAQDFARVAGNDPSQVILWHPGVTLTSPKSTKNSIIVGTVGSSRIIQQLESEAKLDTTKIRGKWESFNTTVIDQVLPGFGRALVISGSDKRGAIFGCYTLSEQIGVSPWYWWADVPPQKHLEIYAISHPTWHGEPSVQYRGIFLNDEAPALTGWVLEKYGKYNSKFYIKIFELLLRLKANFLWPAMWPGYPNPGASFFVDDPDNQRLADEYGIVVSTSHHEPMQRLSNEWFSENPDGSWNWLTNREKIRQFFELGAERARDHESYFTLGMRGEYDKKMAGDDPAAVVQDVVKAQRNVFEKVYGRKDAVPQLFAVYKEVQSLYESGRIKIPDDVTLLFQDDNFGSIRRLPTTSEATRSGGAGVYYHLEYVGSPRSYKWINSNSLGKTQHQLMQAYHHNARRIWIFNVGDLKPLEIPITFVMALAWNVRDIPFDGLKSFFATMAKREFGQELAGDIAQIWHEYDRLVSLRKHELIEPDTFSILHDKEADLVLQRWKTLLEKANQVHDRVSDESKAASFQLILHPVKASYIYVALQITRAKNLLYARQRRNSANKAAASALALFDQDFDLSEEYHRQLNGKWNHMMMQPHYGYEETWHAPSRDMIGGLCRRS